MTQEELNEILALHQKWLNDECCGVMADLAGANLAGTDLAGINLKRANLTETNLKGANLAGADLRGANLKGVKLQGAKLFEADLTGTDLTKANLKRADLRWTDLKRANLTEANLKGADLKGTYLHDANLTGVKYDTRTSFMALQCPEDGAFIAYKKVGSVIIKLEVPVDAKRSSATTRKCRCSKAKVLGFYDLDKNELDMDEVVNSHYVKTIYRKGEMVYPDSWDDDRWNECSNGIHFLMTFEEAKNYSIS